MCRYIKRCCIHIYSQLISTDLSSINLQHRLDSDSAIMAKTREEMENHHHRFLTESIRY